MARDRGPKHKKSRREGVDLYGTGGESLQRRLHQPPGMHGKKTRRRESEYSLHLREKQKVKRMYGMQEKQFLKFFEKARRASGDTGVALLKLLEKRLDNVVYRLGFARTRLQSRQFVSHGHVLVNGNRLNIPSALVEPGSVITLDQDIQKMPDVQALSQNPPAVPAWLKRSDSGGEMVREPDRSEIDQDINERLIVEFYSR
ncbi:MAG: 30S ribosomal protein S4 [Desulfomonilia bacterium]|jgi:small subunit ribosomal protein S4|uniref:30S ribosomal protein S4 n=1 Tax=anaerobic digester metagenome TaxID=1263854 RepID=A0A485LV14_9ZZZZ|nr:30S ribosomal protein S4 [Pseudomonadota bacterium]HON37853.1 30S ribosomal protein S4 [Deltaproteobacteria bacterium]HRS55901.1 30S ribosomal protein S4 [Desulfomonilia bacterium]HPD21112.1 30S ribosomal protein S4 [Deltaproteobacteria bacterium]HPX18018.1 30S ribosomal protein S4 [Deltaproteobacteria bacterium]